MTDLPGRGFKRLREEFAGALISEKSNVFVNAAQCWLCSGLVVWLGVQFGARFIELNQHGMVELPGHERNVAVSVDGIWYRQIATVGYSYDPNAPSSVVFFPAYPLISRGITEITGLGLSTTLIVISNVSFLGVLLLLGKYLGRRHTASEHSEESWHAATVLLLAFLPTGLFFRMAYTESIFLLFVLLAMHGMVVRWNLLIIAAIIGLATATRPVGIALLLPFTGHVWDRVVRSAARRHRPADRLAIKVMASQRCERIRSLRSLTQFVGILAIACWGILAYASYLWITTSDPLAFSRNQALWVARPGTDWLEHVWALLIFEPFWAAYDSSNAAYWRNFDSGMEPLLSLRFADPLYFAGTIVLILVGWCKHWLTKEELLLSAGLLGIPYLVQAYPAAMQSHARFATVVFPAFIVAGRGLVLGGLPLRVLLVSAAAFMLALLSGLFAAGARIY